MKRQLISLGSKLVSYHRFTHNGVHGKQINATKEQLLEISRVRSGDVSVDETTLNNITECFAVTVILCQTNFLSFQLYKGFPVAYSGERERPFWLNVNTFFLNASPTEVCTPGVHVQSIS